MFANFTTRKIEMTKKEALAAGKVDTKEFKELKKLRAAYPDYELEVVKSSAKKADRFKGLTYGKMEAYIKAKDNSEILTEFYTLRGLTAEGKQTDEIGLYVASYGEIKMWFLKNFPEIEKKSTEIKTIIEKAKTNNATSDEAKNTTPRAAEEAAA